MRFVEVARVLGNGWQPTIEALERRTTPIDVLMFQPSSRIKVDTNGVKVEDLTISRNKFTSFLNHSLTRNSHIAIAPEYSCPWETVGEILASPERFPAYGSLWVLGCESIKKMELDDFANRHRSNELEIHYEPITDIPRKFLDPVCYLFWVKNDDGTRKKVLLIQFKTKHMGARGTDPIEQGNLLEGELVYILSNDNNSHRLITLICSEVMSFNKKDLRNELGILWTDLPYLILSLQLNPKIYHTEFVEFRKKVLDYQNKDLLCLNHAKGTLVNNHDFITTDSSMLCINTTEPRTEETRIISNHQRGCYFHKRNNSNFVYQLTNEEGIWDLQIDRPSTSGEPGPVNRKQGPEVHAFLGWNGTEFNTMALPDYFSSYLAETGFNQLYTGLTVIDIEKLTSISVGEISRPDNDWHHFEKLDLVKLRDNDTSQRITVVHNNETDVSDLRLRRINNFQMLKSIVADNENFRSIVNLRRFAEAPRGVGFYRDPEYGINYNFNLIINNGEESATVVFIGPASIDKAQKVYSTLRKLFKDGNRKKVVVWFHHGGQLECLSDKEAPKINDVHNENKFTG